MAGMPGSSASDRDRMCERGSGGRLGAEVGGSGVSDSVIMTFPERPGSPTSSTAGEPEELEASDSTESTGLGSLRGPGRVRLGDASMVTLSLSVSLSGRDLDVCSNGLHRGWRREREEMVLPETSGAEPKGNSWCPNSQVAAQDGQGAEENKNLRSKDAASPSSRWPSESRKFGEGRREDAATCKQGE